MPRSNPLLFMLLAVLLLSAFSGCDTDQDATVTGALYNREPGKLSFVTVDPDSIDVTAHYRQNLGTTGNTFAGTYGAVSAFTLLKFSTPGQSILDSLETAIVTLTVRDTWRQGTFQYALYTIHSEWDESDSLIDADAMLGSLTEPIAIVSDTAEAISSLTFTLPPSAFQDWGSTGSFLLKETPGADGMLHLASDNSTSAPSIDFISLNADAGFDTTSVNAREGAYVMSSGLDDDLPVLSDGEARGYVLSLNLPAFAEPPTPINDCRLTFSLDDKLFVGSSMTAKLYRLNEAFSTIDDVETDLTSAIDLVLHPDSTSITVDISAYIDDWINYGEPNHGILIKPASNGTTPDYAVLTPSDSLVITYTAIAEVR